MNNREIRTAIFENDLRKTDVARALGITPFTLAHWLHEELTDKQRERVMKAIQELKAGK